VYSAGHSTDSVIIKSNDYAPTANNTVTNVTMSYLKTPGDTLGLALDATGAILDNISVSQVHAESLGNESGGWAIQVVGASAAAYAANINISDVNVDWPGGSPANVSCVSLAQSTIRVKIQSLICKNMYMGVAFIYPNPTVFNDISVTRSQFMNIQTNAILTYGRWRVDDSTFENIGMNGIYNCNGLTTVSNNIFISVGQLDMDPAGGSFVVTP
jgi:hypothetical protein